MSEATIVAAILRRLRALGCEAVKIHGGPYQPALVDVVACYRSTMCLIEVKQPGEALTPRQRATLDAWHRAGARVGVSTSADEAEDIVLGRAAWA